MSEERAVESAEKALTPTAPALMPVEGGPLLGAIGDQPEDFQVDEVPLYETSGEGEHVWLHVRKRQLNTEDVSKRIARAAGVSNRDVGYAGMKDRFAVTTQYFSVATKADPSEWDLGDGVEILAHTRHGNKLRTGHLSANRFRIRLVGVTDVDALIARAQALQTNGVLNGYDAQRFGRGGKNLQKATAWAEGIIRRAQPWETKMWSSVLQSEVFNRVLQLRADTQALRVLEGDILRLDGSRSIFTSVDPVVDQDRLERADVHLTGPMFGPKSPLAQGAAGSIESAAVASLGLSEAAMALVGKHGSGARRDLVIPLPDLSVEAQGDGSVVATFTLPSGAYATNVIRHLLRTPWSVDGDTRGAASDA